MELNGRRLGGLLNAGLLFIAGVLVVLGVVATMNFVCLRLYYWW
jgi:hypothetical protein